MNDRSFPAVSLLFLLILAGQAFVPSVAADDAGAFWTSTPPPGPPQGGDVHASCTAIAPITRSCTTGIHTWILPARIGIVVSCPTCAYDGVVMSRVTHSTGTLDLACDLHGVPMAVVFDCWVSGAPPQDGETIRHDCVSNAMSVGRYTCSFATFGQG